MKKARIVFVAISLVIVMTLFAGRIPQADVDNALLSRSYPTEKTNEMHAPKMQTGMSYFEPITGAEVFSALSTSDLIIGLGIDTVVIDTNHVQIGSIFVVFDGVLIVEDGATLELYGHIGASGNGKVIIRDSAYLHIMQYWVGQFNLYMFGNSSFEITDATLDANGVMHYIEIYDSTHYVAKRTHFPDWTFRKLFDRSSMVLEDIGHVGDFMVGDSSDIRLLRCDTLMPWFQAHTGCVFDVELPDPGFVDHFEVSESSPFVSGIGYYFSVDSCARCWWSLEMFSGCSVAIRNSEIYGSCNRFLGNDTISLSGIVNYQHWDGVVPLPDRYLEYDNTYVYWWNWYPLENTVLNIDSCVFGELIPKNSGRCYATRCTHDGATVSLMTQDSSFMYFKDGICLAYLSSFKWSTFLLENVRVTPLWPYQQVDIAHNSSNLLCVNCIFDTLPFALDSGLVIFAAIDSLDTVEIGDDFPITGAAWVRYGPEIDIDFWNYSLSLLAPDSSVTVICDSTAEVHHSGSLGLLDTDGLIAGNYWLCLTVRDSEGDSLTARMKFYLSSLGVSDRTKLPDRCEILISPNPFNAVCRISWDGRTPGVIEIFDILGHVVARQSIGKQSSYFEWKPSSDIPSGIYLLKADFGDGKVIEKSVILLR